MTRNPADGGDTLLMLAPVRTPDATFIGLAVSEDGVAFSALEPLVEIVASRVRGELTAHPAIGVVVRDYAAHFYVHHNFPCLEDLTKSGVWPRDDRIERLSLPLGVLRAFTRAARASLSPS